MRAYSEDRAMRLRWLTWLLLALAAALLAWSLSLSTREGSGAALLPAALGLLEIAVTAATLWALGARSPSAKVLATANGGLLLSLGILLVVLSRGGLLLLLLGVAALLLAALPDPDGATA